MPRRDYYNDYGMVPGEDQMAQRGQTALDLALNLPEDQLSEFEPEITPEPDMPERSAEPTSSYQPELFTPAAPSTPTSTPKPGPDWVAIPGGGWVPPGHPLASQAAPPSPATPPVTPTGQISPAPVTPSTTPATPALVVPPPPPAPVAPQIPSAPTTTPAKVENTGTNLLQQQLSNPYAMSDLVTAMLKEKEKENLLSMYDQQGEAQRQSMAARGMLESGAPDAFARSQQDALNAALTGGYRDLDIKQALSKNSDAYNALNSWYNYRGQNEAQRQADISNDQWMKELEFRYSTMGNDAFMQWLLNEVQNSNR